jgi:hypothetical protein
MQQCASIYMEHVEQVRGAANPPQYQVPQAQQPQPAIMQPTQETLPPAYARSGQQVQQQQMTAEFQVIFASPVRLL